MHGTTEESPSVYLGEMGLVTSRVRVDIVGLHEVTVNCTSTGWLGVTISVSVESWLAEVGCKGRVRQPSGAKFEVLQLFSKLFFLLGIELFLLLLEDPLGFCTELLFVGA